MYCRPRIAEYHTVTHKYSSAYDRFGWLSGVMVRASDLQSSGRGFDSRPGLYRATYVYSAFHPSGVGKSSTGLVGWGYGGARSLVSGGK